MVDLELGGPVSVVVRVAAVATIGWLVHVRPVGSGVERRYISLLLAGILVVLLVADLLGKFPEPW